MAVASVSLYRCLSTHSTDILAVPLTASILWTFIQQACCIIAACLPSLPALIPDSTKASSREWIECTLMPSLRIGDRSSERRAGGRDFARLTNVAPNSRHEAKCFSENRAYVENVPLDQINVYKHVDIEHERMPSR